MLIPTVPHRLVDASCLAGARGWRTHAELLRDGVEVPALATGRNTALLREAEAAERQARRQLRAMRTRRYGSRTWSRNRPFSAPRHEHGAMLGLAGHGAAGFRTTAHGGKAVT